MCRHIYQILGSVMFTAILLFTRFVVGIRMEKLTWKQCTQIHTLVARTLYEKSLGECLDECTKRPYCGSLRYWRARKVCEIVNTASASNTANTASASNTANTATAGNTVNTASSSGVVGSVMQTVVKRSTVDMKTCIEAQRPNTACTCTDGRLCDGGDCDFKECPSLTVTHARVVGNMRNIESNVKVICNFQVGNDNVPSKATCTDMGEWLNVPICPNDYKAGIVNIGNWIISVKQQEMTFEAARDDCKREGGYIIKIDTREKQDTIADLLASADYVPEHGYWIQGRLHADGNWKFEDGSLINNPFWYPPQPDNTGQCIRLDNRMNYEWDDLTCTVESGVAVICEYSLP